MYISLSFSYDEDKAKGRKATDSPSTQSVSPSKARLTKTDVVSTRSKEKGFSKSKATENSHRTVKTLITKDKEKNASSSTSGRSSNRHSATNQPSSKDLEVQRQKLVSRRSASGKPRPAQEDSPSQEQEKRRKQLKRSLSPEHQTDGKQRDCKNMTSNSSAHRESQSEALKEMRKILVSRRSKEFDQAIDVKTSQDKTVPVAKDVDSATKPKLPEDLSHKQQEQCSALMPKISFKIPKKPSTVKAHTNTNIWNVHLASSANRTQCNSQACVTQTVVAGSPSTNTYHVSQQQKQTPQKVLVQTSNKLSGNCSSHPLHVSLSGAVQQVQTIKSKEVTTPSNTNCKVLYVFSMF